MKPPDLWPLGFSITIHPDGTSTILPVQGPPSLEDLAQQDRVWRKLEQIFRDWLHNSICAECGGTGGHLPRGHQVPPVRAGAGMKRRRMSVPEALPKGGTAWRHFDVSLSSTGRETLARIKPVKDPQKVIAASGLQLDGSILDIVADLVVDIARAKKRKR